MKHLIKKSRKPMQSSCLLCGRPMQIVRDQDCSVTREVRQALLDFANENGNQWKSSLREQWEKGTADQVLMLARNIIGPKQLGKYKLQWLQQSID